MAINKERKSEKKSKSLKNYLFEGLMIFLAVLLGFLTENMRENYTDKVKEQQFIESLVDNLQTDSLMYIKRDSTLIQRITFMDTLNSILTKQPKNRNAEAYLLARFSTRIIQYRPGLSTLNFLSKSNVYASITDGKVKKEIQDYEGEANWIQNLMYVEEEQSLKLYALLPMVFDSKVFLKMNQTGFNNFETPKGNPDFLNNDPMTINQLVYHLYLRRSQFFSQIINLERVETKRKSLITFLKKRYELNAE